MNQRDRNPLGRLAVFTILLTLAVASSAWADALEDAKAQLANKEYGSVDKTLGQLLSETPPSPEALRISLDAAVTDGRFFTAMNRCESLLDDGGRQDAGIVATAARMARLTGDAIRETELLKLYVSLKPEKTDADYDKNRRVEFVIVERKPTE